MNINELVKKGQAALAEFIQMDQASIDEVVKQASLAGLKNQLHLAKYAVSETNRGIVEDKVIKNIFATEYIYHSIKNEKTVGAILENDYEGYIEIAEPVGIIAGVTPVTNPTSTVMFKSIIALKTRNPIIFAFHPSAQNCSAEAARIIKEAAIKSGAPHDCIQWIEEPSIDATNELINHAGVSMVLATGGSSMVRAAYSSGKPALGVGPGNVPCYIEKTANIKRAVTDLIMSKTFDNGMICASEQAVIIDDEIFDEVTSFMKYNNCYFMNEEETKKLEEMAINKNKCSINGNIVGQSAHKLAEMAGFEVAPETKILIVPLEGVGEEYPLSKEKLSPILALYRCSNSDEGIKLADEIVRFGGLGHSAVIHSGNQDVIDKFSTTIKTGRLIINSPSTHGAIGDLYNTNMPSLTLGCGSFGQNSTTANVTAVNLINKKRVAVRKKNMLWFKVPERIYFEYGAISYLEKLNNVKRIMIVTDPLMIKLGYVETALYYLRKLDVQYEIFSAVEPDPSFDTVKAGYKCIENLKPDAIIALGGGSVIDAAKGMWLYYEHPETDFEAITTKFMDIRKRIYKLPSIGRKSKFIAIPTTSGTGSEVTSFAVITDKDKNIKYPIADYELTPDIAIIDPELVLTLPKSLTADTGMDVLTHAIEAYVSVMASDYTDALAIKAIELVFRYLPRAYHHGDDKVARDKMHNASCIAGMAFTNAFLGINHSLAHKMGGEFNIPHGRANAILLPHVIKYNAEVPFKHTAFPNYEYYVADKKYAEIAGYLGIARSNVKDSVEALCEEIYKLMSAIHMPSKISSCGVSVEAFESKVKLLSEKAFEDQTTTANPRMPLISELEQIYRQAF